MLSSSAYQLLTAQEQSNYDSMQIENAGRAEPSIVAPSASPDGSYAPGSYTIATGMFRSTMKRQQFAGNQRLTIQGNARLSIRNY